MKKLNLTGHKFNKLTVISEAPSKKGKSFWLCRCDCGQSKIVCLNNLRNRHTQSCGCLGYQNAKTHGMYGTPEHTVWVHMIQRCYNPRRWQYKYYGGRGIKVCERWLDGFKNFYADMGPRPIGMTLDRVDNDGNYTPLNCRWATDIEQRANRSNRVRKLV